MFKQQIDALQVILDNFTLSNKYNNIVTPYIWQEEGVKRERYKIGDKLKPTQCSKCIESSQLEGENIFTNIFNFLS